MCLPLTAEGEFALVREHLKVMSEIPEVMWGSLLNDNVLNFLFADLAALQRREADLRLHAPLALQTAVRDDHKLFQASAHRALGVMHRLSRNFTEAEDHLFSALQIFGELQTRWQLGRTLAELGELATAQARFARAHDYFMRAVQEFDAMGAAPDRARTQKMLETLN